MANNSIHLFVTVLVAFYFLVSITDLPASRAIRVAHTTRATHSQICQTRVKVEIPRETTMEMERNELSRYSRMDFEINDYHGSQANGNHTPGGGGR
ncbi:hypothetical protein OROGR_002080 [Orobanche gracilis]